MPLETAQPGLPGRAPARRWMRRLGAMPAAGTFALALGIYLLTTTPDLTWANYGGDGGELITAAATLGVPHPTGYPLYVILGKLISLLPLGSMAWRFHLLSAICAAAAAALLAHTLRPADNATRWSAGLLLAFTPLVWGQAVIAEVYSLNLLLAAAVWWAAQRPIHPYWRGALWGVSLTTHLTSLWLAPLVWGATPRRGWGSLAAGTLWGLTPWLLLPWLARQGSPVVWGDPATWRGWWWLVSGEIYRPNLFHAPLSSLWPRLLQTAALTWPLLLTGCLTLFTPQPKAESGAGRRLWLCLGLYLIGSLGYDTPDAVVLWLPGALLFSAALAPRLRLLSKSALLLPALALALNLPVQALGRDAELRSLVEPLLAQAPARALVLTPGDDSIFALWYFQQIEKQRPDLIFVDVNLFAFDWYRRHLQDQYPELAHLAGDDVAGFREANATGRAVCTLKLAPGAELDCTRRQP